MEVGNSNRDHNNHPLLDCVYFVSDNTYFTRVYHSWTNQAIIFSNEAQHGNDVTDILHCSGDYKAGRKKPCQVAYSKNISHVNKYGYFSISIIFFQFFF